MAEKTEKASPKKLRDARKKGQIAKSQDAPAAITFIVSIATMLTMSSRIYKELSGFVITTFSSVDTSDIGGLVSSLFFQAITLIFRNAIPIMAATAATGMLVNFLLVGPTLALEAFKPDIKKFDPIQNIKSKFKMKTLVELIKQLAKISGAFYLIYGVVKTSLPELVETVNLPMEASFAIYLSFLLEVIKRVGIFFIVVAAADFFYQRKTFSKEMMMEKHEVKQEYKNSEGDPQIKSKRKQIAQENANSAEPAKAARNASAIVTNPIHIAVAIAYEPDKYPLPYICALGKNALAQMIVKEAEDYDVPIMRNIPLAHDLYDNGEIWDFIPEDNYEAVAEILRWVASLTGENDY